MTHTVEYDSQEEIILTRIVGRVDVETIKEITKDIIHIAKQVN